MRIIAGSLKGHEIKSPHGHRTHPMSEKARGSLFNALGDIEGLTFLDAFAGSGALAFEAVSRGAKSAIAIDKDRAAHSSLDQNVKELKAANVKAIRANTGGWSIHNMEKQFDIVLLDPPYDDLQASLLERLAKRHVKAGGLAVLSYPGHLDTLPNFADFEAVARKDHGDIQLVFYRKKS